LPLFQKISAIILVSMLCFVSNMACAQEGDIKSSESNISERINFIQTSFDKGQTSAMVWSHTWMGVYGALTGLQTYQAMNSGHQRAYNIVGASESFLGLAMLTVNPFHACSSGSDLRRIPESTLEEQKNKLDKAESWLERNYKQEKLGRSWLNHVAVLAVGVIGGGIVWHNNGHKSGMTSALTSFAVSEVQIWTQPTRGISDYNDYHSKYKGSDNGIREKNYFIAASPNGFVAGIYF